MDAQFLTNRTQQVFVNNVISSPTELKYGPPQGSVLQLLHFLILIGDIDQDVTRVFFSCFTDDTRIGRTIWNSTTTNLSVCDIYPIKHSRHSHTVYKKGHCERLSVTMTNDGTFKKSIQHAVSEAKCGLIMRTFGTSMEVTWTVQAGLL